MLLVETDPADRPLCIQLYGRDPAEMADAARWAHDHAATIVDINMGCPVDKVCKRDAGSALLRDPASACDLAAHVVTAVPIPVTVKMRLGWDDDSLVAAELARRLEDVGVAAITVHGRTAAQKFSGSVRHDGIARVVDAVRRIPVIGNGDIRSPADAKEMIDRTGCAGLMIGRAALGDPWIFRDTHAYLSTGTVPPAPTLGQRVALMTSHFEHLRRIRGDAVACTAFRQRASWYTRHFGRCPVFREKVRFLSSVGGYYDLVSTIADNDPDRSSTAGPLRVMAMAGRA